MEWLLSHPVLATYLLLKVPKLAQAVLVLSVPIIVVLALIVLIEEDTRIFRKYGKYPAIAAIIATTMLILTPSRDDLVMMVSVGAGVSVYNAAKDSSVVDKAQEALGVLINEKLDSVLGPNKNSK